MKIRITKRGLPKAQVGGECPQGYTKDPTGNCVQELQSTGATSPNYTWANVESTATPVKPAATAAPQTMVVQQQQGTPAQQGTVVPIKKFGNNSWMNADKSKLSEAFDRMNAALGKASNKVNNGVVQADKDAREFLSNNKTVQGFVKAGTLANKMLNVATPFINLIDQKKQNKEMEKAYRDSMFAMGPVDFQANRGDYEINNGMVDPYNTGAKSKGQFTNPFYMPMAADGISVGPISMSGDFVRRNVYQSDDNHIMDMQPAMVSQPVSTEGTTPAPKETTRAASPALKDFIAAKESGGNYKALPKNKSGHLVSSAAGKYQFLWNQHKNWISKVTGVTTKEQFLNNPDAQERAFDYWNATVLTPNAEKIKQELNVSDSLDQIKAKIHFAGAAGAYKYYAYGHEVHDAFGTSTSTYQMGGENFDSMKIKITQEPLDNMAYGGQMGYGFDTGARRVYTDMPKTKSESVGNTMGPVPEEEATIEAERGETILTQDGHFNIGGKRHSEGGTPLAAEQGDFVYSDTKKMKIKDPEVLKMFGVSSTGSFTPAKIAKRYDLNKYQAILDDPHSDPIAKKTAEHMITNYKKKLGDLAMVQESMKGFPNGIPAVAQRGGEPQMAYGGYLPQYQSTGEVKNPRSIKTKEEFDKLIASGKYKQIPGTNNWEYHNKTVVPGQKPQDIFHPAIEGKKYVGKVTPAWLKAHPTQASRDAANKAKRAQLKKDPIYQGKPAWTEHIPGTDDKVTEEHDLITYTEPTIPNTPGGGNGGGGDTPGTPKVPEFNPSEPDIPYAWTQQDKNNLLNALNNRTNIRKYQSVRRDVNPVMSDFRNMDWRGKAAELQGTYNSQMNTMGTYGSPQGLAANAAFMAGQQAENLINRAIEPTEQQNVQIYNQVAGQNAQVMNAAMANNAQNTFMRSVDRANMNQNYDNSIRAGNNAVTQTVNQGITNASGIYNTNITESPYYYYDPRFQKMKFNGKNGYAKAMEQIKGANPNAGDIASQASAMYKSLAGMPDDLKKSYMDHWMASQFGTRGTQTSYPYNPARNKTTTPIPFGYSPSSPWDQQTY